MMQKKVFGYPEFDSNGEKVLTTYDGSYRDMLMDIRVLRLKTGEKKSFKYKDEELAILLLKGKIIFTWDNKDKIASRKDIFSEGAWVLHVCANISVDIQAIEETEIIVQRTHNNKSFDSRLYKPDDTPLVDVCRGKFGDTANRFVRTFFDYDIAPYSNMVLGEVINDRGNWSGFIPHHHPQPEVYYFRFDRPEGFGASFVGDDVFKSTDGSFSAIPGGKVHPQVCAPGYKMYTCWMIRHLENNPWNDRIDDERYSWLNNAEF